LDFSNLLHGYAHLRRVDKTRAVIAQLRALHPGKISLNFLRTPLRDPQHRELSRSGLELADVTEE